MIDAEKDAKKGAESRLTSSTSLMYLNSGLDHAPFKYDKYISLTNG